MGRLDDVLISKKRPWWIALEMAKVVATEAAIDSVVLITTRPAEAPVSNAALKDGLYLTNVRGIRGTHTPLAYAS